MDEHTTVLRYDDSLVVLARLSGGGDAVELQSLRDAGVVLTTEDDAFATDPMPVALEHTSETTWVARFARPSAIVLADRNVGV